MIVQRDAVFFMKKALEEARLAEEQDEIPVGAVIVSRDKIIARAHNLTERLQDVTAHAEMLAITSATHYMGGKYLEGCTLYVTLEPCLMCAGALYWSRISKVVFAASDPKRGYRSSGISLHPKTAVESGVMEKEASELIRHYFLKKR